MVRASELRIKRFNGKGSERGAPGISGDPANVANLANEAYAGAVTTSVL